MEEASKGSLSWDKLPYKLETWIVDALKSIGYKNLTPVQAAVIPLFSMNKDVVVEAVTGSGKTLSFAIPVLEKVVKLQESLKKGHMIGMVISPTRELANQINNVFQELLKFYPEDLVPIKTQLLVGSLSSVREDLSDFLKNKPQIIVGTPGRILDFLSSNSVKTSNLEVLVLDEADKLLDIGFEKDVINITKQLPRQRRTGLFSATISAAGNVIFKTGMTNPVKIVVRNNQQSKSIVPTSLGLSHLILKPEMKIKALVDILSKYHFKKAIVYFSTCTAVTYFYAMLKSLLKEDILDIMSPGGLAFFSLHGKLPTKPRLKTLENFTNSVEKAILLTTDVAARGLDIPEVELVIQMEPPTDPEVFLHRSGRTGRADNVGRAIVMLNEGREEDYIDFMKVKNVEIDELSYRYENSKDTKFDEVLRDWILQDRARHDLAVRAYVSFVRYYSKHSAKSIFRLQSLDYVGIAKMYGLLRLPRMPEIRNVDKLAHGGWLCENFDMDNFKYLDDQKEKSRLKELEELKSKKEINNKKELRELKELQKKKNLSWSDKTDQKENKATRKEKLKRKREAIKKQIELNSNENESSSDEEAAIDWKDIVKSNKRSKKNNAIQGNFDDL
ncbi:hypothetical protein PACTADRAFT_185503 [Pachysolen tannophilus NRRL Y-2460]|uniref:ATP-dependent RNA helicase n=1 Tax=Pachysolen tannophilus NRRL Y-2460 TaxID=669874 RepID=A0A1E4U2F9_PACTA|nr:hypothetical protein PACTADRAFT_185503 [Pachysolen tannophilus NRRL Y-2460]